MRAEKPRKVHKATSAAAPPSLRSHSTPVKRQAAPSRAISADPFGQLSYDEVLGRTEAQQKKFIEAWNRKGKAYGERAHEWPHPSSLSVPALPSLEELERTLERESEPKPSEVRERILRRDERHRGRAAEPERLAEFERSQEPPPPWGLLATSGALVVVCVIGALAALRRRPRMTSRQVFFDEEGEHPLLSRSNLRRAAFRGGLGALALCPLGLLGFLSPRGPSSVDFLMWMATGLAVVPVAFVEFWAARKRERLAVDLQATLLASVIGGLAMFLASLQVLYIDHHWAGQGTAQAWSSVLGELSFEAFAALILAGQASGVVLGASVLQRLRGARDVGWGASFLRIPAFSAALALLFTLLLAAFILAQGGRVSDWRGFTLLGVGFLAHLLLVLFLSMALAGVYRGADALEARVRANLAD